MTELYASSKFSRRSARDICPRVTNRLVLHIFPYGGFPLGLSHVLHFWEALVEPLLRPLTRNAATYRFRHIRGRN